MQKSITQLNLILLVMFFISALFHSEHAHAKTVTVKGISDIIDGKKVQTRNIALNNAKRAAVEQVAGAFVQSRTSVNDFVFAQDKIYSSSSGNISSYNVVSEGVNDFGAYEVVIEAIVDVDELLSNIKSVLKVNGWNRKPRVIVDIKTDNVTVANTLRSMFTALLTKNDFEVFDSSTKVQTGFVLEVNADYSSSENDYQGVNITSNNLALVSNIKRTNDGQILATTSYNGSKASSNQAKVIQKLSKSLVSKSWRRLKVSIIDFWQQEQDVARSVYLTVNNLDTFQKAQAFSQALKRNIPGMVNVELLSFEQNNGQFLLKYKGWPEQFYNEVFAGPLQSDYQLNLISVKSNNVTLRIN